MAGDSEDVEIARADILEETGHCMSNLVNAEWHSCAQRACRAATVAALVFVSLAVPAPHAEENSLPIMDGTYVYAAVPGVDDDLQKGGAGIVVFDADHGYKFVKRIVFPTLRGRPPEVARGIVASVATRTLYVSETNRLIALDLETDKILWMQAYDGWCCDRPDISPDSQVLYVPALDHPYWYVVSGLNGQLITKIPTTARGHNTQFSPKGDRVYLSPASPIIFVADAGRAQIIGEIGPFSARVRPFVINGAETNVFANITGLLGIAVGNLKTGKVLAEVRVPNQYQCLKPPVSHDTCSHGIALTPDEREIWIADANHNVHVFDARPLPPKYETTIRTRAEVGWLTCSIDGKRMYPSSGDVIDIASKQIIARLIDEKGRALESEKLLEVKFANGKLAAVGNQWCNGRVGAPQR
jgi:DNA-binding beta-propeller fold protein YncE